MCDNCDVGAFHAKFGLPMSTPPGPRIVPEDLLQFRIKFLKEELKELEDAIAANDMVGVFDALLDLVYVAHGTAHIFGFPWHAGWDYVQAANMAKIRAEPNGSNSRRGSSWDVVKPPGWVGPEGDLANLLEHLGWNLSAHLQRPDPDPAT